MKVQLYLLLSISLGFCALAEGYGPNVAVTSNQEPAPQSAETQEATRLAQAVVKLFGEGKYDEAYPLAKRALELREKELGKDDAEVLNAVLNLAEVQWKRGKYDDSKRLFDRVLHTYERTLGPDNIGLTGILNRIALVYFSFGQFDVTEKLYKRSIAIREKALGPDHVDVARAQYELAEYYQFQGDYKKAEPLYERVLDIRRRTSASPESIAEAIDRYACVLRKDKRIDEAERMEMAAAPSTEGSAYNGPYLGGGVLNGRALNLVQPPYPAEARSSRASGRVTVRIVISEKGDVIRVCAIDGPKVLMKASESAAARSKFTPTRLSGQPVRVMGLIIYNYVPY